MRAAAVAIVLATSGCIISDPSGAPQFWPPGLGGTVEAVVSADLDANGSSDVVVLMAGTRSQAGLYLLKSNVDLIWDRGDVFESFSTFVPMELVHPTAAYVDSTVVPRIFVTTGTDTLSLSSLSNTFNETAFSTTGVIGGGSAWTKPIVFPGNQVHYAVSNGSTIEHLSAELEDPRPIPAPMAPTWTLAQTVTSYDSGAGHVAVVATATAIYRCIIPTTPGSPFEWELVRMPGAAWSGQTTLDYDGDGREEIVGFDVMSHRVCAIDPSAASIPITPVCLDMMTTFTGTDVTIVAGQQLSMSAGLDLLVVQASGGETSYSIAEDVQYTSPGTLTSAMLPRALPVTGPPRGRTVLAGPGTGRPLSVLTFGTDGQAVCALGPC